MLQILIIPSLTMQYASHFEYVKTEKIVCLYCIFLYCLSPKKNSGNGHCCVQSGTRCCHIDPLVCR